MKAIGSYFYRVAAGLNLIDRDAALQSAAENGHTDTVRALLETGADVLHALGARGASQLTRRKARCTGTGECRA
jgi:hypothetical protein